MRGGIFRNIRAYIVAVAVIFTAIALVSAIYLTRDNLPWTAFLTGILVASVLAEAARATRSEWLLMRRTAQLAAMKDKFELELRSRKSFEGKLAEAQARMHLVDETLLTMVVLVDAEGHCRYHNRAFRELLNLKTELINGRHLRELFGFKAYAGIATAVRQSLDGQSVHYEHLHERAGGVIYRLAVEHVPQFDAAGHVTGFYLLAEDITKRQDLSTTGKLEAKSSAGGVEAEAVSGLNELTDLEMSLKAFSMRVGRREDAGKQFIEAIQRGAFCLYCELISPLPIDSGKSAHYEILIRMMEEEGSMIPPGEFFQLAEENGLMPYLDRWVIRHVLEWASNQQNFSRDKDSIYFINAAAATLGDPEFPEFLLNTLTEQGVPGSILCFEVSVTDLAIRNTTVVEFIRQVRQCGCRVALSGFGRNADPFDQIRGFQVDFLKIDGSTILNMLTHPADIAKVASINRTAKKIGVKTIAELVESDEIAAKLSEIGVDYAQGFGISRPRSLVEKKS